MEGFTGQIPAAISSAVSLTNEVKSSQTLRPREKIELNRRSLEDKQLTFTYNDESSLLKIKALQGSAMISLKDASLMDLVR